MPGPFQVDIARRIYLGARKIDPVNNPPTVSPPTSSLRRETALVLKSPNHQEVQALSPNATRYL
jgi:hypothetical protein